MHVDLDKLDETILVEVETEVVDEVEWVANNDEQEFVRELGLFEEVLDFLWVVSNRYVPPRGFGQYESQPDYT